MREKKEFYSYRGNHYLTVKDLAKMNGVPHEIIALRLKEGWSVEKATETPAKRYKYKGESYTILGLFDLSECKASLPLLYDRLEEKQWPVENALSLDSTPEPKQVKSRSLYKYKGK